MKTQAEYDAFIEALKTLYEEHGLYIDSCGCCPPFVCDMGKMTGESAVADYAPDGGVLPL